jgi:hypothetical protein
LATLGLAALELGLAERAALLGEARATAEANAYERQDGLWLDFMKGFVQFDVANMIAKQTPESSSNQ